MVHCTSAPFIGGAMNGALYFRTIHWRGNEWCTLLPHHSLEGQLLVHCTSAPFIVRALHGSLYFRTIHCTSAPFIGGAMNGALYFRTIHWRGNEWCTVLPHHSLEGQ